MGLSNFQVNGADLDNLYVKRELFNKGGLWGFGNGGYGQLGDNSFDNRSSPVQTVSSGSNWKLAAGGLQHSAAIKTDGTLWTFGQGTYGQMGDNTSVDKSSPVQTVSAGTNWKTLSCGQYHVCSIKSDGTLWLWGLNSSGELGDNTITNRSSPVQTTAGGSNWKQVSCGGRQSAAIKTDGTLWVWGSNGSGQLGDNTTTKKSSPVQTVAGGTNWKQVSVGSENMAAIKTDGTLWTWGRGTFGNLGDNTTSAKSSPVQTVAGGINWKRVSCSGHVAAIKTDGTLWLWGYNAYGELGDNTVTNKSSPVQTVSAGTNWKLVSVGSYHTAAIKTDGTLWSWGRNNVYSQLGDNTDTNRSSPVQTVSGGTNWIFVSAGENHTFGIRENYS